MLVGIGSVKVSAIGFDDQGITRIQLTAKRRHNLETSSQQQQLFEPGVGLDTFLAAAAAENIGYESKLFSGELFSKLKDKSDMIYTARVDVGSPPQAVDLVVDTGSSDIWITQTSYKRSLSSSIRVLKGPMVDLTYGSGQVFGPKVRERVCVQSVCIPDQLLVAAEELDGVQDRIGPNHLFDGLLGLAYPSLSQVNSSSSFVKEVSTTGPWNQFSFGLCLKDLLHQGDSFVIFGNFSDVVKDAQRCNSKLHGADDGVTIPALELNFRRMFWMSVATVSTSLHPDLGEAVAIFDSGTSLITVPADLLGSVTRSVLPKASWQQCGSDSTGTLICPCTTPIGTLSFTFRGPDGGITIRLGQKDILQPYGQAAYTGGPYINMCRLALMSSPMGMPFWILGDVFLRRVYLVHDVSNFQVTIFEQKGEIITDNFFVEPEYLNAKLVYLVSAVGTLVFSLGAASLCRRKVDAREFAQNFHEEAYRSEYVLL